ncbi:hypothetical protein B566_EDAN003824 [Ephemera danica]|nr:hypothetical protein B566_EDAN003824 [Ephemera danica]
MGATQFEFEREGRKMRKFLVLTYSFLLYIPVAWCVLNTTLATRNNTRIVFAVDTSASLELKNSNFKIKQAISTWIKYLAPSDISVGIIELKQGSDGVLLKLDEPTSVFELVRSLPDKAYGPPCLLCGLQAATKLLGQTTAQDTVVLLMEELSIASPHDTPQYAIEQIGPNFPIFTVGLTENAAEGLEILAKETNGLTDYVREITVARLLQSFSILTNKDYTIITTEECDSGDECNVAFYIDDELSDNTVLLIFICPSTGVANATNFEAGNDQLSWDNDVHCWVSKQRKPKVGTWQLKQNKSEAAISVIVMTESQQNVSETQQTISASNEEFTNTVDPMGNHSLDTTFLSDKYNSTTGDTTPEEAHKVQNETFFKNTKSNEDTNEQDMQLDGAQITIVIVGAILIVEIIFIVYNCKAKQVEEKSEKNNLIPYSVSYKDDFELHLNSMQYKDNCEEI